MITVETLVKAPSLANLRVVAGHKGLNREVKSVSIMDAPDSHKWLKGKEFILTTGFMFGGDDWQFEHFISNLVDAGCSAAGVKKGRFVKAVPEAVMRISEQNQFPIIMVPYNFGWSDIITVFYCMQYAPHDALALPGATTTTAYERTNITDKAYEDYYREFLLKVRVGEATSSDTQSFDKAHASDKELVFGILLVKPNDKVKTIRSLQQIFSEPRLIRKCRISYQTVDDEMGQGLIVLLIIHQRENEPLVLWQNLFLEELEYHMDETDIGNIYMGGLYPNADGIARSYREATETREIGPVLWSDKRCFFYPMLSVYSTLRKTNLSSVDLGCINTLEQYKDKLAFDGIESLEAYIECGGYKEASRKLSIHGNTLRYRIQRIADFLHLNLDDRVVCDALITQVKLWKLKNKMVNQ